jgi:hypothetical protein
VPEPERISWHEAEPERLDREQTAMAELGADLRWLDELSAGGWEGPVLTWTANRPAPVGLQELLGGRQLHIRVEYLQGFPMVPPVLIPVEPEVPVNRRLQHEWHVNGDGSLCLLRATSFWSGTDSAADLVAKAAGWFVEYRLMEEGRIDRMTEDGIYEDTTLDQLIKDFA